MFKRMTVMLVAMAVLFGGLYAFQRFRTAMISKFIATMANPPQTVATEQAAVESWQSRIDAVCSLRAVRGADLALQTSGIVKDIRVKSGDAVTAGETLLELRAEDDVAKLRALEATADMYAITLRRDQQQLKINGVSQATVDGDLANLKNAQALAAQQQALNEQKILKAPFAGKLGIRSVDLGQYLAAGTTVVTLQALDALYADCYLPQQTLSEIEVGQGVTARIDAYPGRVFPGEISAINAKVETSSRNVQVRATLPNPDQSLLPGMYATLEVATGRPQRLVTLPQTAITTNPYGDSVFIVERQGGGQGEAKDTMTVRQEFVKTGPTRGDQVAILSGVKAGDEVVVAGQIKLRNGSPIAIDNAVRPSADANPTVPNE